MILPRDRASADWSHAPSGGAAVGRTLATASWYFQRASTAAVYRLRIGDAMVLPCSEVQCRRRVGASAWLIATVPTWSPALEAQVLAAVGQTVYADMGDGYAWAAFLEAVITEIGADVSPTRATLQITGRVQNPRWTPATRVLDGVQRRGADAGRRSCRCAVDPLLRPNDTVDDGEGQWLAGSISYRIGAREAWMDVTEALDG